MRKAVHGIVFLMLCVSPGATAEDLGTWHDVTFNAPVPCAFACPYWLDELNTDLDSNGKEDVYFQACANPDGTSDAAAGIPGLPWAKGNVYDEIVVGPAPGGVRAFDIEASPLIDWDIFVCAWREGDVAGEELNNLVDPPPMGECAVPAVGVGCVETVTLGVVAGRRYIIRAYNWSDPMPLAARYRFRA